MHYTFRNITFIYLLVLGTLYPSFAQRIPESAQSNLQTTPITELKKLQKIKEGSRAKKNKYLDFMLKNPEGKQVSRPDELLFAYKMNAGKRTQSTNLIPIESWKRRGPFNVGGRTRALAIDRTNEQVILAGGVSGGMWRSADGGATWSKVTGVSEVQSVTDIYQDPNHTNTWYYVTGEVISNSASANGARFVGSGVFKSTDGGLTWVLLPSTTANQQFHLNFRVRVHPVTSDVYVAGFEGIKRSTDGGTTWSNVLHSEGTNVASCEVEIGANGVIYASIEFWSTSNKGVFRSINGTKWANITPTDIKSHYSRIALGVAPSNHNIVFAYVTGQEVVNDRNVPFYQIFRSSDAGLTWDNRSANLPRFGGHVGNLAQGGYNHYIKIKPDNPDVVFLGSTNIYRSTNGFADTTTNAWIGGYSPLNDASFPTNFRKNISIYTNHHPDNHAMVFYPSNPNRVLTGHDGGVSRTENILQNDTITVEPVTWESLSQGYNTTQPYAISIDPLTANDHRIIAGFQDNGSWITTSRNSNAIWEEVFGADGAYSAIEPGTNITYFSMQNGLVLNRDSSSFTFVSPNVSSTLFINPFVLDRTNYKRMYYLGFGGVYRNPDLTNKVQIRDFNGTPVFGYNNWEALTSTITGPRYVTSGLDVAVNGTLYYGDSGGQVFSVPNAAVGQPAKQDIFTGKGLPTGAVSSIVADPVDSSTVYLTFSNYGIPSIFYTENGGNTWVDISGNLEENPDGTGNGPSVRWMTIHRPATGAAIYFVGTSIGLFSTTKLDGANTVWNQEGGDVIGNVVTTMVKTRASDGLVVIATHGNGIYSANLVNVPCKEAQNLNANNLTKNSATLNWDTVYTAQSYDVRYRLKGDSLWKTEKGLSKTSLDINELTGGGQYEFQVRANCLYGSSDFGTAKVFQTYCIPQANGGVFDSKVKFAGIKHVSLSINGHNTFQEFTNQAATLVQGGKYKFKSISQFRKRHQVWIDYNQDGDFDDVGEKVYQSQGYFFGEKKAKTWVKVPADAQVGKTRMRVVIRDFFQSKNACENVFFGKVEDYMIYIQAAGSIVIKNSNFDVETKFKVFPNPTTRKITTIAGQVEEESDIVILLTNINGVGLRRKSVYTANGNFSEKMDLNGLKSGIYLVHIISGDTKKVLKLLLQ